MPVWILGGGVAGLSAAHELSRRNYEVKVFEQNERCGGKARSYPNELATPDPGKKQLPAEHGFRFFPGFYWHLDRTMAEIPDTVTGKFVLDNLVAARDIGLARIGQRPLVLDAGAPGHPFGWIRSLRDLFTHPSLGISRSEALFFLEKFVCFASAGPSRRLEVYEKKESWWKFVDADNMSDGYKEILARGLTRSLVAMRAEEASVYTIGRMLIQIAVAILKVDEAGDRILNGPTNDVWIGPWMDYLEGSPRDVTFLEEHEVVGVNISASTGRVTEVRVLDKASGIEHTFGDPDDYFIVAMPVEDVQRLDPTFKSAAGLNWPNGTGGFNGVDHLDTEWMTGIMYYMDQDTSMLHGHMIYSQSDWALTSISQRQFWTRTDINGQPVFKWDDHLNGNVRDILSVDLSDWKSPGNFNNKTAMNTKKPELLEEAWDQLQAHRTLGSGTGQLVDGHRVEDFIDKAIEFDMASQLAVANSEPLLVNKVDSLKNRPDARPEASTLANVFFAADYIHTNTDLACMEAANEAAKTAVNELLDADGSTAQRCPIHPLREPWLFEFFQAVDEKIFDPSNPDATQPPLCQVADWLVHGNFGIKQLAKLIWFIALGTFTKKGWPIWILLAVLGLILGLLFWFVF